MFASTIFSNMVRLSIAVLLVNIVFGLDSVYDDNRRLYQLLKQRSADNDNEYVWFTRDLHGAVDDDREIPKPAPFGRYQHLFRAKSNYPAAHRQYPSLDFPLSEAD